MPVYLLLGLEHLLLMLNVLCISTSCQENLTLADKWMFYRAMFPSAS